MDEESKSQDFPKPPPLISPSTPRTPQELGEVVGVFGWVKALLKQPVSVARNVLNEKGPNGT